MKLISLKSCDISFLFATLIKSVCVSTSGCFFVLYCENALILRILNHLTLGEDSQR